MMSRPPATMPMQKMSGKFKDGSYVGSVADAIYGNIQVKATIQNGQLSDVVFLQYPNDRDRSIEINTFAMPILKREAIAAQSAEVDVVSGATDSSIAFTESLTSALSKAL
ncbi:FMN-binding protein [Candidatus Gottesmanbacteria bacterium]|nr:FMN-binding protein [Candidatus Gottesmanbacteria bacterium]